MMQNHLPDDALLKQSPWLVKENRFSRINDRDQITGILRGVKNSNSFLTLSVIDNISELFFDSFLLDVDQKGIRLYKSPKWPESKVDFFRIFFRNSRGVWYSMKGRINQQDTHSISIAVPDTLHILRQRSCRRLEVPEKTRAAFIHGNRNKTSFQVLNISRNGALLCSGSESEGLTVMSRIGNIIIDMPEGKGLPAVRQGQVVRRFKSTDKNQLCYGILFKNNGEVNEKKIWDFISQN